MNVRTWCQPPVFYAHFAGGLLHGFAVVQQVPAGNDFTQAVASAVLDARSFNSLTAFEQALVSYFQALREEKTIELTEAQVGRVVEQRGHSAEAEPTPENAQKLAQLWQEEARAHQQPPAGEDVGM